MPTSTARPIPAPVAAVAPPSPAVAPPSPAPQRPERRRPGSHFIRGRRDPAATDAEVAGGVLAVRVEVLEGLLRKAAARIVEAERRLQVAEGKLAHVLLRLGSS